MYQLIDHVQSYFQPPQAAEPWSGIRNAQDHHPECLQIEAVWLFHYTYIFLCGD